MAVNFEEIITRHAGEDGTIAASAVAKIVSAISAAVGKDFIPKERYNAKLEEIETLKAEKQTAEDNAQNASKWEKKYESLKSEYEGYKTDTEARAALDKVKAAYRKLLKESNIDEKRIDTIIKATSFDGMKLDAEGALEGREALQKAIDAEWADFKVTTLQKGADVATPPKGDQSGANARAAELAKQYHERLYGTTNEQQKG